MRCCKLLGPLIGLSVAFNGTVAIAQDQDEETTLLGRTILYGDRTANRLGDAIASVGVVGAKQLDSPLVSDFRDVFARVANVLAGPFTESGFHLRGVNSEGQTPGAFGTPLASLYIDGVQQTVESTRRGARGMFDTEQVEIYRGPQSTLSGRAALGGAIYVRSIEPVFDREGRVQLTYGENNHRQIGLAYNDMIAPNLAFRISAEWSDKDSDLNYPDYEQYALFDEFATDDYRQIRARLLWLPDGSDTTRVYLTYAQSHNSPYDNTILGPGLGFSYGDRRGDTSGTAVTPIYGGPLPAFEDVRRTDTKSFGIEVEHDISEVLTLTAMTGWNNSFTDRDSINVGSDPSVLDEFTENAYNSTEFDDTIFSQEVRLNYDDGELKWVAGLYGATEENHSVGDQNFLVFGWNQFDIEAKVRNFAIFGDVTWPLGDRFRLLGGARIDYFSRDSVNTTVDVLAGGIVTTETTSFEDTVVIPKIGFEYDVAPDQTIALVYQEGYRPGGSGIQASTATIYEFDPERAQVLELSYRGSLMDGALSVAGNLFYQKWKDQQVETGAGITSRIDNVGSSESYGAELELAYSASDELELFGSLGLLHTELGTFVVGTDDYSGLPFPGAPELSLALGYTWQHGNGWFSSGTVSYVGKSTSRLESGVQADTLDARVVVDMSAGYAWDNGAALTFYANNLFDEEYFVYESPDRSQATLGDRREVGLRLDYRF